jgi:hypothetical protein
MHEEALVDESRERGQHGPSAVVRQRLRGFDREGTGEGPQPLEEVTLGLGQQRVLQSIVARSVRWRAGASRRPAEGVSSDEPEVTDQDARLEHPCAGGDELDRERQVVDGAAHGSLPAPGGPRLLRAAV